MKKYFTYALKQALWPTVILFVVSLLWIILPIALKETFIYTPEFGPYDESFLLYMGETPPITSLVMFFMAFSFWIPVLQFYFAKNRRLVDQYYSAPIKRKYLLLTNYLVGYLILASLTIVITLLLIITVWSKPNPFVMPHFFILIPFLLIAELLLYSINTYVFHKANSIFDGLIFMAFATVLVTLVWRTIIGLTPTLTYEEELNLPTFLTISPFIYLMDGFTSYLIYPYSAEIGGRDFTQVPKLHMDLGTILDLVYLVLLSGAAVFLLLFLADKEKPERAGQISDGYFGYKVMNPLLIFTFTVLIGNEPLGVLFMPLPLALILTLIYRRSFKVPFKHFIPIIIAYLAGIGVNFLSDYLQTAVYS